LEYDLESERQSAIYLRQVRDRLIEELKDVKAKADEKHQDTVEECRRQVEEASKISLSIINRCSQIEFSRDQNRSSGERQAYFIKLGFSPELVTQAQGVCQDELRYIARTIGLQVEHEIASTKFLVSIAQAERDEKQRRMSRSMDLHNGTRGHRE
jgi:hypothetical protein